MREECEDLLTQITENTAWITARGRTLKDLTAHSETARYLRAMPGVGPLTALVGEAFGPGMALVRRRRDLRHGSGWCRSNNSPGGRDRFGRASKAGQADIRRLLIIGAMSRTDWLERRKIVAGSWLARILDRKPKMLAAIALANKMARQIWAMLPRNEDFKDRSRAAVARPDQATGDQRRREGGVRTT